MLIRRSNPKQSRDSNGVSMGRTKPKQSRARKGAVFPGAPKFMKKSILSASIDS